MGKWLMLLALASGCAHSHGDAVGALIYVGLIAAEIAVSQPPRPQAPLCTDDETDPPHTCPGTTPAPPEQ